MKMEIKKEATYTIDEVALHRNAKDHWTVINGKVYDLTSFVSLHPGGPLILSTGGIDASVLYEQYHFQHKARADAILKKYYVGEFEGKSPKMGDFWNECSKRVAAVLGKLPNKGRFPLRAKYVFWFDTIGLMGLLWGSLFITKDTVRTKPVLVFVWRLLFFGIFLGRFQQQNHALGHFMLFKSHFLTICLDHLMLMCGSASAQAFAFTSNGNPREKLHLPREVAQREYVIRGPHEHQAIHHVRGATLDEDQCRMVATRNGRLRMSSWDKHRRIHSFQTSIIYQYILNCTWAVAFILSPIVSLAILSHTFAKNREWSRCLASCIGVGSSMMTARLLFLPLQTGTLQDTVLFVGLIWFLVHVGLANTFGWLFFAQHRWDVSIPEERAAEDWGRHNAETSVSLWPTNGWHPAFWFQGRTCPATLSFHLEHTLFPSVPYLHLEAIGPVVEKCAKKHGVEYTKFVGTDALVEWINGLLQAHANPDPKVKAA